jgi:hypothetical protein
MATRNIVPRANGEGSIGTLTKKWGALHVVSLIFDSISTAVTSWSPITGRRVTPLINNTEIAVGGISGANIATGAITGAQLALKTVTSLLDANATLTAAQLITNGGLFTITPTNELILTTDTATNIIGAAIGCTIGTCYEFKIINLGFQDFALAAGTGVTLVGNMDVFGSQWIGEYVGNFLIRIASSSAVTIYRI